MFNLNVEKGYYPFLFNTKENKTYIGPIPDVKYFGADAMSNYDRERFLNWHNQQVNENIIFNNRNELIKYCKLDVEILRKSCAKFSIDFWEKNKIDPFVDAITIADA